MNMGALGDQAQGYALRSRGASLKQDIQRLTAELTTGQVSDVRNQLAGNYSFLTDAERKLSVLGTYAITSKEAAQFTGAMQLSVGNFGDLAQNLSSSLIAAGTTAVGSNADDVVTEARATFDSMVSTLNGASAGRSMFAGNATDQPALVDSDTLIADLTAAMAGAATPADMIALADAWFADPAGFSAVAYQGGTAPMSDFAVATNETVTLDVRATDPGFTTALRAAAVASLATDPAFALPEADQAELFSLVGRDMLVGQDDIIALQSRVGFAEARIETIAARNAAEVTSLSMARNALLETDPYETATQLEEVQFQLQSLYSVTVRMSQLSLVNYL